MIEVVKDPDEENDWGAERCCFCRRPTRYWFTAKDVAVCRACAAHAEEGDVPSKKVWYRREEIASGSRRPPKPQHRRQTGEEEDGEARVRRNQRRAGEADRRDVSEVRNSKGE